MNKFNQFFQLLLARLNTTLNTFVSRFEFNGRLEEINGTSAVAFAFIPLLFKLFSTRKSLYKYTPVHDDFNYL